MITVAIREGHVVRHASCGGRGGGIGGAGCARDESQPAPAIAMSALFNWICSIATPMQWAPVEHAEEMEKDGPCNLKLEERTAETVEPMVRVTR